VLVQPGLQGGGGLAGGVLPPGPVQIHAVAARNRKKEPN